MDKILVGMPLLFTSFQIGLGLFLAPGSTQPLSRTLLVEPPAGWVDSVSERSEGVRRYLRFNNWDSLRYFEVAKNGYHTPSPEKLTADDLERFRSNCAFFPGYPVLCRWVAAVTGVSLQMSLLLVSLGSTLVFWFYFFSLLRIWKVDPASRLLAGALALTFPTSFYLVMGYSESLFLAQLLGYIYWTERCVEPTVGGKITFWRGLAMSVHGFGMGVTRLMGVAALPYPVFRLWRKNDRYFFRSRKFPYRALVPCFFTFLGCIYFFVYCQVKFGMWNLYVYSAQLGWGVTHRPLDLIKPWNYIPHFFFETTEMSLDRSIGPLVVGGLIFAYRKDRNWVDRAGLYFAAIAMFYLIITSKVSIDFIGSARHGYSVFILLLLAIVQFVRLPLGRWPSYKRVFAGGVLLVFLGLQVYLTYRFLRGRWVE